MGFQEHTKFVKLILLFIGSSLGCGKTSSIKIKALGHLDVNNSSAGLIANITLLSDCEFFKSLNPHWIKKMGNITISFFILISSTI